MLKMKTTMKDGIPSPEQCRFIYLGLLSNPKVKVSSVLMLCHRVLVVNFICSDIVVEANNPQTFFTGCQEFWFGMVLCFEHLLEHLLCEQFCQNQAAPAPFPPKHSEQWQNTVH